MLECQHIMKAQYIQIINSAYRNYIHFGDSSLCYKLTNCKGNESTCSFEAKTEEEKRKAEEFFIGFVMRHNCEDCYKYKIHRAINSKERHNPFWEVQHDNT